MKVAIIGSNSLDSLESNLQEAFVYAGYEARVYDIYDLKRFSLKSLKGVTYTLDKIARAYSDTYDRNLFEKLFYRVKDFSPELVVCVYRFIHPSFVDLCKAQGAIVIHVNPDALTTFEYQQVFASNYDAWFTKDPYIFSFMKGNMHLNVYQYNEAFNARGHKKPEMPKSVCEEEVGIDVMTYGTMYPYRCRMLKAVADSGINLKIYGTIPHRFYNHDLDRCYQNKYITGAEKSKLLFGAKIVFNQMHYAEIESVNNRFFEVNGSGAFQLSDYRPILKDLLPVDPKLVSFSTIDEGIEKIKYYLNHPDERYEIAEKIYTHFATHYSYDHLINYLVRIISTL